MTPSRPAQAVISAERDMLNRRRQYHGMTEEERRELQRKHKMNSIAGSLLSFKEHDEENTLQYRPSERKELFESSGMEAGVSKQRCLCATADDLESGATRNQKRSCNNGSIFIERDGKSLTWADVNMTLVPRKSKHEEKNILTEVWGEVPAKSITAIMGPSGSGKTSLLKILAGRAQSSGKIAIKGTVRLNNEIVDPTDINVRRQLAYIEQETSIHATSTPREAIKFSARLRLDRQVTIEEIDEFVEEILDELGLSDCADTLLGGGLISGISGGERKRTSVGVELVVRPSIIVFDEPTSGLDSFSAEQLVSVLKKVAAAGSSVLFTIHQPPSSVFKLFDHLILLNKGRAMYNGTAKQARSFFAERGYPCPSDYNPADWVLTVAQAVPLSQLKEKSFFPENSKITDDVKAPKLTKSTTKAPSVNHVGLTTEIRLLFLREMRQLARDKASLVARFGISVFFNLLFGLIFLGVGDKDPAVPAHFQGHFGAITNLLISTMFGVAQASMLAFPQDRPIFLREYSTNHYSVFTYFVSRLTVEATTTFVQILAQVLVSYFLIGLKMGFLIFTLIQYVLALASTSVGVLIGSYIEDPKVAAEMMPILIVPQCLFAGFFVSTSLIPTFLRWAQYLCSLTYAVRLSLFYEFRDCGAPTCTGTLEANAVYEIDTFWYWLILCALFLFFRMAAILVLRSKATFH